jgi:hypothetical protein
VVEGADAGAAPPEAMSLPSIGSLLFTHTVEEGKFGTATDGISDISPQIIAEKVENAQYC